MIPAKLSGAGAVVAALLTLPVVVRAQDDMSPAPPPEVSAPLRLSLQLPAEGDTPTWDILGPSASEPPPSSQAEPSGSGTGFAKLFNQGLGASLGPLQPMNSLRFLAVPAEHVRGQSTDLSLLQTDLSLAVPVWLNPRNTLLATASVRNESLNTDGTVLPLTGQPFPDELWSVRMGLVYRHEFENGWNAGLSGNFGSASDRPFHSIHELTGGVNAFLAVPQGDRNAWLFTLLYSPTGQVNFPVPGVAYLWQPTDNVRALIGVPFVLWYRPLDDLTLDISWMPVTNVRGRAAYQVGKGLRIYSGFDWENQSYFLADRPDISARFFSYDKRLSGGVQLDVGRHFLLDLSSGYLFDRYYFLAEHFSTHPGNRIDISNAPFLGLQGRLRW
jgi:hypothetical protein